MLGRSPGFLREPASFSLQSTTKPLPHKWYELLYWAQLSTVAAIFISFMLHTWWCLQSSALCTRTRYMHILSRVPETLLDSECGTGRNSVILEISNQLLRTAFLVFPLVIVRLKINARCYLLRAQTTSNRGRTRRTPLFDHLKQVQNWISDWVFYVRCKQVYVRTSFHP